MMPRTSIASVPLVVYSAGLVASRINPPLNAALGRTGAYVVGVELVGAALAVMAVIQPLPSVDGSDSSQAGGDVCESTGYAVCVPWPYIAASALGLGCSILLPTVQSMVSELVPAAKEGATASLWVRTE